MSKISGVPFIIIQSSGSNLVIHAKDIKTGDGPTVPRLTLFATALSLRVLTCPKDHVRVCLAHYFVKLKLQPSEPKHCHQTEAIELFSLRVLTCDHALRVCHQHIIVKLKLHPSEPEHC